MEDMYRLLAIAKYDERYVIPLAHKELAADELYAQRGTRGLDFARSHGHAANASSRDEAYFSTEELQRNARALYEQGGSSCSLDFAGGPGSCASAEGSAPGGNLRNNDFYAMKDELERKARQLGRIPAPNVQLFRSKKDFEAFHLRPGGSEA
jgi:nitrate reductase beta subunit